MSKYINPFLDWSFKHLFGQESNKDLLIDLINAVLQGDVVVQDVEFLNKERQPEVVDGKAIIYDLLCRTDQGEYIIVEMQNNEKSNFKDRSLFYMSRAVVDQARKGNEWRYNLKAVYGIFFVNFKLEDTGNDDPTESRTEVVLMNRVTHKVFNRKFIQIFVEIPLFNKQESDCQTD